MAQVTKTIAAQIDDSLDYLTEEWQAIPRVAREWTHWSPYQRLDFVLEWPIREDRLAEIEEYAERGQLTPDQRSRRDVLRQVVAENRAVLEQLLAD